MSTNVTEVSVRKAELTDLNDLAGFVIMFYTNHNDLSVRVGIKKEDVEELVTGRLQTSIEAGNCFVATINRMIVGVISGTILNRDDQVVPDFLHLPDRVYAIESISNSMTEKMWEYVPSKFTTLCHLSYCAVAPNYEKLGVREKLLAFTKENCKQKGVRYMVSICLEEKTSKLMQNCGFSSVYNFDTKQIRDKNDKPFFDKTTSLLTSEISRSVDDVDILINPEGDYWTPLVPGMIKNSNWPVKEGEFEMWKSSFFAFWYIVAVEKYTKKPVCCVILVLDEESKNGSDRLYSAGFYYTDPEWRRSGVGVAVCSIMTKMCGEDNFTGNGILHMASLYIESLRQDKLTPFQLHYARVYFNHVASPLKPNGMVAKELHEVDWNDVLAYDKTVCPRPRPKFLKNYIQPTNIASTRVIVDDSQKVVGFGSVREDVNGAVFLAPLYADSKDVARLLIDSLLLTVDRKKFNSVVILYPGCNTEAERLLAELSGGVFESSPLLQPQFSKYIVPAAYEKVFGFSESGFCII